MMTTVTPASRGTIMSRGFTRRCPRCGAGKLFRAWIKMVPDCPRCGLHFERESGYWAGALAINFVCTGGLLITVLVALLVATIPEVPVVPILAVLVPIAIVGPLVWYPFSKTLWLAIDQAFLQRMDPEEQET
jgi:uncharacterized protein (DUF983 family)